jgi:hypothetical protein
MDDVSQMNKGVQILLERMSSNPDEFVPDIHGKYPPKWRDIIISVYMRVEGGRDYKDQLPFLTHQEIKALWKKMQSLQGELFTKRVMNTLLQDADNQELSLLSRQATGGSKQINLSKLDVMTAQKMGMRLEAYAQLKAKGELV